MSAEKSKGACTVSGAGRCGCSERLKFMAYRNVIVHSSLATLSDQKLAESARRANLIYIHRLETRDVYMRDAPQSRCVFARRQVHPLARALRPRY